MYQQALGDGRQTVDIGAVPRQVKPPAWLRNIVGGVIRGAVITVPTPVGPQQFNVTSQADLDRLKAMISGTKLEVRVNQQPGPMEQISSAVQSFPGGAMGMVLALLGGAYLLKRSRG